MRNELTTKQFRGQLYELFKNYPEVVKQVQNAFSEDGDLSIPSKKELDIAKTKQKKQQNVLSQPGN